MRTLSDQFVWFFILPRIGFGMISSTSGRRPKIEDVYWQNRYFCQRGGIDREVA
jgi:hypothetical protein